jgi:hypothetical protein
MWFYLLLAISVVSNSNGFPTPDRNVSSPVPDDDYKLLFAEWMRTYNKTYAAEVLPFRFQIWKQHYQFIEAHNEGTTLPVCAACSPRSMDW